MAKISLSDEFIATYRVPAHIEKVAFSEMSTENLQLIVRWQGKADRNNPSDRSFVRTWFYRFTLHKRATMKLGNWPQMSIEEAIKEAGRLSALVRAGVDPRSKVYEEKAKHFQQLGRVVSNVPFSLRFEGVIAEMEEYWPLTGKSPQTFRKYKESLQTYALPHFVGRNIRSITGNEWDDLILDIANVQGKPGAASNLHKAGRRLFSFALEREIVKTNPLLGRNKSVNATRIAPDERFLEAEEISKFMNEIDKQSIAEWVKVQLKLMMMVGVRVEEWKRVRIGWINFKNMRIEHPADSMKNRRKAWTHLPQPAIELLLDWLKRVKADRGGLEPDWFLFSSEESPTKETKGDLSERTKHLRKEWIDFVPKMLRKTISTHLQRQGCPPVVLRAIRNQVVAQGVEVNYDFDDLFHLKKQWIEKWVELLEEVKKNPSVLKTDRDSVLDESLSSAVDDLFS